MTPEEYQKERRRRGTQAAAATLLGVSRVTIARRETGVIPITREAWLALLSLPVVGGRTSSPGEGQGGRPLRGA
jgi:hypothetical protein